MAVFSQKKNLKNLLIRKQISVMLGDKNVDNIDVHPTAKIERHIRCLLRA